jgi:hypothetical protein
MNMSNGAIRRWALLGALASGALLTGACERQNPPPRELDTWPKTGVEEREGKVNQGQPIESFGEEQQEQQPSTGGSGSQQHPSQSEPLGAPGYTTPREDGDGAEVLRDAQTEERNTEGEGQR